MCVRMYVCTEIINKTKVFSLFYFHSHLIYYTAIKTEDGAATPQEIIRHQFITRSSSMIYFFWLL